MFTPYPVVFVYPISDDGLVPAADHFRRHVRFRDGPVHAVIGVVSDDKTWVHHRKVLQGHIRHRPHSSSVASWLRPSSGRQGLVTGKRGGYIKETGECARCRRLSCHRGWRYSQERDWGIRDGCRRSWRRSIVQ